MYHLDFTQVHGTWTGGERVSGMCSHILQLRWKRAQGMMRIRATTSGRQTLTTSNHWVYTSIGCHYHSFELKCQQK